MRMITAQVAFELQCPNEDRYLAVTATSETDDQSLQLFSAMGTTRKTSKVSRQTMYRRLGLHARRSVKWVPPTVPCGQSETVSMHWGLRNSGPVFRRVQV
ncbi:hypothetical protein TNCV_3723311 [Trichonephila clavipes]|nr:hypothetical protein TNCV_3723311 [Trichonephila clavipes]